ncbi:MAG: MlaD family protein [Armatimonadota bacterium]
MRDEAKVGAFFVIALVLVTAVVLFVGDYMGVWASTIVTVHFENTAGLQTGAEVRLSGVRVGRVLSVALRDNPDFPDQDAAVRIAIDPHVRVYAGDDFFVEQGALIGDKYVSIVRTEKKKKRLLKDGEHIAGAGLAGLSGIPYEAEELVKEARQTVRSIETTLMGDDRRQQIDEIMKNVIALTARADRVSIEALHFARNLSSMSDQTKPHIAEISKNLVAASESVNETARIVQATIEQSPVPTNAALASENLVDASKNVQDATQRIAMLVDDPKLAVRLENALANMDTATQNLAALTERADRLISDDKGVGTDVRQTMENLRSASGDLAETSRHIKDVLTDRQVTEDLKTTVSETRRTMEEAGEVTRKAGESLDRVNTTMDRVSGAVSSVKPTATEIHLNIESATKRHMRADFNADLHYGPYRPNEFWRIGVRDAGDSERLNLQRAVGVDDHARMRFGIRGGQPAVGYDQMFSDGWFTEIDFWDPDEKRVDVGLGRSIGPADSLFLGTNDVFSDPDYFIGYRHYINTVENDIQDDSEQQ